MTSNILAGERRWASARRTGMTVLGKVAVPKPLNLPSQRLENHGVDPNVDIVPKGSSGWGSRPSSSASNPWGSSALSPNTDGSASSPSHLSGRPSSGGSGSRPSTAGSERTHERSSNAWGVSSRPSSASGISSTQTSLRPRSAETRPNSSQLSRFAEPVSEVVSRGPVGTAERRVATSSENDRFSLISGDFPTLSSSKENSAKNHETQDQGSHSRPSSASSRCVQKKECAEASQPGAEVNTGTVDTWSRDGPQNGGDGVPPNMEKWHCEPQKYHNPNIPPPQFDAWGGPPMNGPAGVWYRGPHPGPPYGGPVPPVGPGGFPIEPFPYYCPQIPPAALANSQPVPLPGVGPRGPRPKNGEMFRPPHMADAFVRPGMPFRPGFYPGPVPFDGYYGPPMGYHNSNEREAPFKGTGSGPSIYNRYPVLNTPDTDNSHAKTGISATGKTLPAQVESIHSDDPPGQYKVLLKQNNEFDAKERGENKEHMSTSKTIHHKERGQPAKSYRKNEWGADHNSEDDLYPGNMLVENSSPCNFDDRVGYSSGQVMSFGSAADVAGKDTLTKKMEPSFHGMSQPSPASGRGLTTSVRDSSLMQKIEGLNEKARASDGRSDGTYTSHWEGKKGSNVFPAHEMNVSAGDRTSDLTSGSRRPYEGMRSKHNDFSKRRFNSLDVDGRHKKPVPAESFNVHEANVIPPPNVQESKINPTIAAAAEGSLGSIEGESLSEGLDSTDTQAQRAKMRELAKQRAIQLQKEEEERTREQKAKALAKLEELNRRTQGISGPSLTAENAVPTGVSQHEIDVSQTHVDSLCLNSDLASSAAIVTQVSEKLGEWSSEEPVADIGSSVQTLRTANLDPDVLHGPSLPLKEEMHNAGNSHYKPAPQVNEPGPSRHKRNNHRPRVNGSPQMDTCEKSAAFDASKSLEDSTEVAPCITAVPPAEMESRVDSSLRSVSSNVAESVQQRKKSNRNSKNKQKLDSAPSAPALALPISSDSNSVDLSAENEICNASQSDVDSVPVGTAVTASDGTGSSDVHCSSHNEGVHGKVSNLRKPQQQNRRFPRNQQSNRFSDKYHGNDNVMWAPVRSQNKSEPGPEMGQKPVQESVPSTKGDNHVQSNIKNKRAEMERYVPKPVAKELAQQGGVQQSVTSSVGLSTSDETGEKVEPQLLNSVNLQPGSSATGNKESIVESEWADSKHNKQSKVHGAWRRRGATDSHVKGWQNVSSSSTSNSNTSSQGSQYQFGKTDLNLVKADHNISREVGSSNSGNINESNAVAPAISSQGRDPGVISKGKRHPIKGERNRGNDNEEENNINCWETDRSRNQVGDASINQTEKLSSSRESKGHEERTSSHWQPKSNSLPNNSLRGGRTISNQPSTGEASGLIKKNHPSQPRIHIAQLINNNQVDQSESENKVFSGAVNVGHQGHGKEKKQSSYKGRPFSPSNVSVDESTHSVNEDLHNKQHVSSEFRRTRNQNNRPSANRDSRADWNLERHRQNAHYEYQPVGPYNNNRAEKIEDVSNNMGPRYKDRSQSHPKRGRGNYHGRQSGNVRADAGYG